ncbi:MAG: hypothetical protein HKN56_02850 [Gammaproteobacteria bacterium]|nr:hypothetical protein [Gammaproteobacteria bacterium]
MSEQETAPDNQPEASSKGSGGKALGSIAAILALAAIGAAGYVWTEVQKLQALPQQLQAGAGQTQQLRSETDQQLKRLAAQVDGSNAGIAELQELVAGEVAALAELSSSVAELEEQFAALTGSDQARRNRFLQAEALYYLRVANARASLASDADVARSALEFADEKLQKIGNPRLAPVRAALAQEIAALKSVPDVDVTGVAFALQALAAQVDSWPLQNPPPERFNTQVSPMEAATEALEETDAADAWTRFRATVADVFGSIVKVRDNTDTPEVQLSEAQYALVIQSVRGEIQVARLSLVTGEYELYTQALGRIDEQIRGYFNTADQAVEAALATVAELSAVERPAAMPDISGSLALLLDIEGAGAAE